MGHTAYENRESISDKARAETSGGSSMSRGTKRAFTGFGVVMLVVLAFVVVFFLNVKTIQVSGSSMLNTFKNGDRVFASKAYWMIGPIKKKDIVVIRDDGPTGYIIKRVAYMAGEAVDWKDKPESAPLDGTKFVVPAGHVFVLGDNRNESEDSRKFGPVAMSDILWKVVVWP